MADDSILGSALQTRRQSRGVEPQLVHRVWRRRLLIIGSCLLGLTGVAAGIAIWYYSTHVQTLSARVRAPVVQLSAEVEARLLELFVDEKSAVRKGDVMARLDNTELQAALKAAEATRAIRQSACEQAQAQKRLVEARIRTDIAMAEARVTVAQAQLQSLETALQIRRKRLPEEVRQAAAQHEKAVANLARLQSGARAEDIEVAKARLASAKATLELYELEVEQSRQLVDEGIDSQHILEVRRTRLRTQLNAVREAELDLQRLLAGPRAEELEVAQKDVDEQAANLAMVKLAELDLQSLEKQRDIRMAELQEAKAAHAQAEARKAEIDIATQQLAAALGELQKAEAELAGRQAALDNSEIRSPIDGTVVRVFADVGEVCRRGVPIILVSDGGKERWLDAFVDEEDALLVSPGQRAKVRVPANSRRYIEATVEQIGLHTQSLDSSGGSSPEGGDRYGQPDRVWVMLVPAEPIDPQTITGTTARATIRVR